SETLLSGARSEPQHPAEGWLNHEARRGEHHLTVEFEHGAVIAEVQERAQTGGDESGTELLVSCDGRDEAVWRPPTIVLVSLGAVLGEFANRQLLLRIYLAQATTEHPEEPQAWPHA